MATTAWKERNKKKAETVKKYAALRAELKEKGDYAALIDLGARLREVQADKELLEEQWLAVAEEAE